MRLIILIIAIIILQLNLFSQYLDCKMQSRYHNNKIDILIKISNICPNNIYVAVGNVLPVFSLEDTTYLKYKESPHIMFMPHLLYIEKGKLNIQSVLKNNIESLSHGNLIGSIENEKILKIAKGQTKYIHLIYEGDINLNRIVDNDNYTLLFKLNYTDYNLEQINGINAYMVNTDTINYKIKYNRNCISKDMIGYKMYYNFPQNVKNNDLDMKIFGKFTFYHILVSYLGF